MKRTSWLCMLLFLAAFSQLFGQEQAPNHEKLTRILQSIVDKEGMVNYLALAQNPDPLLAYLEDLEKAKPWDSGWTEAEQLAFWINAYNAFTLQLILDHYPVESIRDIGSKIQIPFINSPWDKKFITIGGQEMTLNNIEHGIIRKKFDEPRIHFALVCAAKSCPKLRNEAYTPDQLKEQLQDQSINFLNDPAKNRVQSKEVHLSRIFSWYKGDFTKSKSLIDYINQFAREKAHPKAKIQWMDYDWSLNQPTKAE